MFRNIALWQEQLTVFFSFKILWVLLLYCHVRMHMLEMDVMLFSVYRHFLWDYPFLLLFN